MCVYLEIYGTENFTAVLVINLCLTILVDIGVIYIHTFTGNLRKFKPWF